MSEKKATLRLEFETQMPPMPASGYGAGTPANSNQDWYAADTVGMGLHAGKFNPNKWGRQAQALADFHLQNGRVDNTGWSNYGNASDLTHAMHTTQGRYQSSIPGTVQHQAVQAYKSGQREEAAEKKEAVIQHLDNFTSKLQTAATSLAYLTGMSGGVANAFSRAAGVFAAFQGVSGVLGMGGGSVGSAMHGIGSAVASGGVAGFGAGALGLAGLGIAGISAAGSYGPMGSHIPNQGQTFRGSINEQFFGVGTGNDQGSSRNILSQIKSDWNRGVVNNIGGGTVNSQGNYISQAQQLQTIQGQHALRMNSYQGTQGLENVRLGVMGERQGLESSQVAFQSQFSGYGGYSDAVGDRTSWNSRSLGEQPQGMLGIMNKVYGNNYQAGGELALRMQGINEQSRGYAVRSQTLSAQHTGLGEVIANKRSQLREVQANTAAASDRDGPQSGAAYASREREKQLSIEINGLLQQETMLKKEIKNVESDILKEKRQQAVMSQQQLQGIINSERQGQDQSKLSYGRLDPGQRQYVQNVLQRFDKSGRDGVSHDEMATVEQYRRREADKLYRDTAEKEGFSDRGTMRDSIIKDAEGELKNQKQLELNLTRQIDMKLTADNQQLVQDFLQAAGPAFTKLRLEMKELGGKVIAIAEGLQQIQSNQKTTP